MKTRNEITSCFTLWVLQHDMLTLSNSASFCTHLVVPHAYIGHAYWNSQLPCSLSSSDSPCKLNQALLASNSMYFFELEGPMIFTSVSELRPFTLLQYGTNMQSSWTSAKDSIWQLTFFANQQTPVMMGNGSRDSNYLGLDLVSRKLPTSAELLRRISIGSATNHSLHLICSLCYSGESPSEDGLIASSHTLTLAQFEIVQLIPWNMYCVNSQLGMLPEIGQKGTSTQAAGPWIAYYLLLAFLKLQC